MKKIKIPISIIIIACCLMMSQACNRVPPSVRKVAIKVAQDAVTQCGKTKSVSVPKPYYRPTPNHGVQSETSELFKVTKKLSKEWLKEDEENEEAQNKVVQNHRTLKNLYYFPEK